MNTESVNQHDKEDTPPSSVEIPLEIAVSLLSTERLAKLRRYVATYLLKEREEEITR